ncbi:MAG: hypothetical protein GXY32_08245 [Ruminococcaceae bacterium]|nr:hypothetical protein [Oscillospiraceae bacterium]
MPKAMITKVIKLGIAVKDLEKSVQLWEQVYGIGPWKVLTREMCAKAFTDVTYKGKPIEMDLCLAITDVDGLTIELLQQISDEGPFSDFIEEYGEGIQHMAVEAEDGFIELLEQRGNTRMFSATMVNKNQELIYFDSAKDLGFTVEVFKPL